MEGLSLGGLILELGLNLETYEADLQLAKERAIAVAGDIERSFKDGQQFGVGVKVDDRALYDLNKHLDIKKKHFDEVNHHFKSTPLKPRVDLSEVKDGINQINSFQRRLDEVKSRSVTVRFSADTSAVDNQIRRLENKTIKLKTSSSGSIGANSDTEEAADIFGKAIAKAIKKSNSKGIIGHLFDGIGAIASVPFKVMGGTIANVLIGSLMGIGDPIGREIGEGIARGIQLQIGPIIGSLGLAGEEAAFRLAGKAKGKLASRREGAGLFLTLSEAIGQEKVSAESRSKQFALGGEEAGKRARAKAQAQLNFFDVLGKFDIGEVNRQSSELQQELTRANADLQKAIQSGDTKEVNKASAKIDGTLAAIKDLVGIKRQVSNLYMQVFQDLGELGTPEAKNAIATLKQLNAISGSGLQVLEKYEKQLEGLRQMAAVEQDPALKKSFLASASQMDAVIQRMAQKITKAEADLYADFEKQINELTSIIEPQIDQSVAKGMKTLNKGASAASVQVVGTPGEPQKKGPSTTALKAGSPELLVSKIMKMIADREGFEMPAIEDFPRVSVEAPENFAPGEKGMYREASNTIRLRRDLVEDMLAGNFDESNVEVVTHEIVHAFQSAFGKVSAQAQILGGVPAPTPLIEPTPEELATVKYDGQTFAERIEGSTTSARKAGFDPKTIELVRANEIDAYTRGRRLAPGFTEELKRDYLLDQIKLASGFRGGNLGNERAQQVKPILAKAKELQLLAAQFSESAEKKIAPIYSQSLELASSITDIYKNLQNLLGALTPEKLEALDTKGLEVVNTRIQNLLKQASEKRVEAENILQPEIDGLKAKVSKRGEQQQRRAQAIAEQENRRKAAEDELRVKKTARSRMTAQDRKDYLETQIDTPIVYFIQREVARLSGRELGRKVTGVEEAIGNALQQLDMKSAEAAHIAKGDFVLVRPEAARALRGEGGQSLDDNTLRTLLHELRHSAQRGFGTIKNADIAQGQFGLQELLKATPEEMEELRLGIEHSVNEYKGDIPREIIWQLEEDAYVFELRYYKAIQEAIAKIDPVAIAEEKARHAAKFPLKKFGKSQAPAAEIPEPPPLDLYTAAVQKAAQAIAGRQISAKNLPSLEALKPGELGAEYKPDLNAIALPTEQIKILTEELTKENLAGVQEVLKRVTHEATHALQYDFGQSNPEETGINPVTGLQPTPEELKSIAPQVERSVAHAKSRDPRLVRQLESQAYVAQNRFGDQIARDLVKQKAIAQFQAKNGIGGDKLKTSFTQLTADLNKAVEAAAQAGIDASADYQRITQRIAALQRRFALLIQQSQNLEFLPAEEILDLQEKFEKSVSKLVPVAREIQSLSKKLPGEVAQSEGAIAFTDNLGVGAGKLRLILQQTEVEANEVLELIAQEASSTGMDVSQEIQRALATIEKTKSALEPLFEQAAQIEILPEDEIKELQAKIVSKAKQAARIIEQQPEIAAKRADRRDRGQSSQIVHPGNTGEEIDREGLRDLLKQFGVKKLKPLAQEFGIDAEGVSKRRLANQLIDKVDPRVLQPRVYELTRAKAQQQVANQERMGAIAEGAGSVARKLLNAGQSIANALAPFGGVAKNALGALGAVAKAGYQLAEGAESLALDIIPLGRTIKGIGQQIVIPAATFGAATHFLPGGQMAAEAMTNMATGAISPFVHGAAGGAMDAAGQFISHAVPNVMGIQAHLSQAVNAGIGAIADTATTIAGQAGAAVLGGKAITAVTGRGLNATGNAVVNALAPAQDSRPALPPSASVEEQIPLQLPMPSQEKEFVPVEVERSPSPSPKTATVDSPVPPVKGAIVKTPQQQQSNLVAKAKSAQETAKNIAHATGGVVRAAADVVEKTVEVGEKAVKAVSEAGQQAIAIGQQINPADALAQIQKVTSNFTGAYKNLQDTLKKRDKAAKKGDLDSAAELTRKAQALADVLSKLAEEAQKDIAHLTNLLGDAAAFGTTIGSKLANAKSQITQKRNSVVRMQKLGKLDDVSGAIDVSATSSDSDSLAAFEDLQKLIDEQKQRLTNLAQAKLSDKDFVNDQIVNAGGFIGSQIGGQFGLVGELSGDLLGALATRQALVLGQAGSEAFGKVKDTDEFKQASKFEKLIILIKQLKKELQSPEIQKAMGGSLTGDIAGFAIGNMAAKLGTAGLQAMADTVPGAGMLAAVPAKGAIAAYVGVKPIVEARDRFAESATETAESLAAFEDLNEVIEKQKRKIADLLKRGRSKAASRKLDTPEVEQKVEEVADTSDLAVPDEPVISNAERRKILKRLSKKYGKNFEKLPDVDRLAALAESNQVMTELQSGSQEYRQQRRSQQKMMAEHVTKGYGEEFAPIYLPDGFDDTGIKKAFSFGRETINDVKNNYRDQLLKQAQRLMVQGIPLVDEVEGSRQMAIAAGDQDQVGKLEKFGAKAQKSVAAIGEIIAKPTSELTSADIGNLQTYNNQLVRLFKIIDRPVPPDPGGFGAIAGKMNGLMTVVKPLMGAFASFASLAVIGNIMKDFTRQSLQAALNLDKLSTAMTFASGSSAKAGSDLGYVEKVASDLKIPLGAAREGFVKLTASTRGTKVEGQATRDLFLGVSQAATVLGMSAEDTNSILFAFSQVASKGKVQSEELRCFDSKTAVLTDKGWVYWPDINDAHQFASRSLDTGRLEYQKASNLVRYHYQGKMLQISGSIDALVTPDHRMVVRSPESNKYTIVRAKDLKDQPYYFQASLEGDREVLVNPSDRQWIDFDDEVFCAEVPFTTLYVRRGGIEHWSGNSQIGERLPGAFGIAAKAMGVTEAELGKMMELGQVTAEEFLPKMAAQLQSTFGGAAVNASKDAQSAIYDFDNSLQKLQENFGKTIQPAQVAGFRLATDAIEFLADKGDELAQIFIVVSTVVAGRLAAGLAQAVLAFAQTTIAAQIASVASQIFAKGIWAATASIRAFMLQMALVYGAMEAGRVLFETFVPTGLAAEFDNFADQAEAGLMRIEQAARKARGEVEAVKPGAAGTAGSRQGMDEGLESKGVNFGLFKSDDALKWARSLPGIKQAAGFAENVTGGRFTPFTTQAEHQYNVALEKAGQSSAFVQDIAGQAFDSAGLAAQIGEVASIDAQLKELQASRQALTKQGKLDKNQIKELGRQEADLQARRDEKAAPILELQSQVGGSLQGSRAQLEAIEAQVNSGAIKPENAERLKAFWTTNVSLLEKAEANMSRLQKKVGQTVDPVRQLAQTFEKIAIALESAQESNEKMFLRRSTAINKKQLEGFSTDIGAARDAAVERAEEERDRIKRDLLEKQTALSQQAAAVSEPGAQQILKNLTSDGEKPLTVDSTFAELESARKKLTDKQAGEKEIIDKIKTFKEMQKSVLEAEGQIVQAEQSIKESIAQRTNQDFQENFQLRDSQIQRSNNNAIIAAKKNLRERITTEEQGAIDIAKIQENLTSNQIKETEFQLETWRQANAAGAISAEQFAQKRVELEDKISGLQVQKEEAITQRIEAERRKRLTNLEQANKKTEAAIALSQTVASAAIKSKTMAGLAPEDAAIAQTDVQQTANAAKVAQIKREIEQTKALQADGTISAKEATEKQIQLQQQLAEANAQAVDLQIQKQEQLRAAIERSFQRRREQLKLEQTAAENELQAGAIAAMRSGPIDTRALELSTQGQSLGLRAGAIANEIALLQQEMAELDALGLKDQDTADKRRALSQQMLDLERDRISNIKELDQNAREQEVHRLEQRAAAQKRASDAAIEGMEREKAVNDLLTQSFEVQAKLFESRANLVRASADLSMSQSNAELKRLERAQNLRQKANDKDATPQARREAQRQLRNLGLNSRSTELDILKRRQAIENDIASRRLQALEMEQSFQRQSLEIDLKRQRIAAQNVVFEAEIAKLRAQASKDEAIAQLNIAKASGDTTKIAEAESRVAIASREIELTDLKLGNAQQSLGMQDQLEADARNLQSLKQQSERVNFNSEMETREGDRDLARADLAKNVSGRRTWKATRAGKPIPGRNTPGMMVRAADLPQLPQPIAPQVPQLNPMAIAPAVANFVPPTMPKMASMPDYGGHQVSVSVATMSVEVCRRLDTMIDRLTAMDRPTVGTLNYTPQSGESAGSVVTDLARARARGEGL